MQENLRITREATPAQARAPRGLRRVGLFAAVVAIAVVAFGIVERRHNEVTVAQWTEAQAIPEVAVITPKAISSIPSNGTATTPFDASVKTYRFQGVFARCG